jgi:hypothetical protein
MGIIIEQPQGKIIEVKYANGKTGCRLLWNEGFKGKWSGNFNKAQTFVDQEVIRLMDPYTPNLNGVLIKTAVLGTKIGEGEIHQIAPYARYQYYGKLMVSSTTGSAWSHGEKKVLTDKDLVHNKSKNPLAGPLWFERMKTDKKDQLLRGIKKVMNNP